MKKRPRIEIHSLLHNEAPILPYFVQHYSQYGDITFYESDSTDGSPELARILGAKVLPLPTGNESNEIIFLQMKNNCWKNSKADWVIICDTDEFVWHPNLINILSTTKYNMFYPEEWIMVSEKFPTTHGQIYDEVKYGIPGMNGHNKLNIFRPGDIKEMNYEAGCHSCNPVGNLRMCPKTDILTLHFFYLGIENKIRHNKYIAGRLSEINRQKGWGIHVQWPEERIIADFKQALKDAIRIIP